MKRFLINIWLTFGFLIELTMSKMGLIKYFDLMAMDDSPPMDNMGGTLAYGYIALAEDVATWPTFPDVTTTTMEDLQELEGTLVMNVGKNFFRFRVEPEKCSISSEDVGPKGGVSQKHVLKIYKGSMEKKIRGFIRATNNQELVFAMPDANDRMNFIGTEKFPARKMPEGTAGTGEGPEGESGAALTFVSYHNGPVPILPDTISVPTTPQAS